MYGWPPGQIIILSMIRSVTFPSFDMDSFDFGLARPSYGKTQH